MPAGGTQCPAGVEQGYSWDATDAGVTASQPCGAGFSGTVTRVCSEEGVWGPVENTCCEFCYQIPKYYFLNFYL